jgi:hypothetical protein
LWLSTLKPQYRLKPGKSEQPLIARAASHAEQLILRPPGESAGSREAVGEGGSLRIEAPWPNDLVVAVKYLRRYGGRAVNTK